MRHYSTVTCLISAAILSLWQATVAADSCEYLPRPPVPISGALCGIVADITGEPWPGVELQLLRDQLIVGVGFNYAVVATTHSDDNARFSFGQVPDGEYRIGAVGLLSTGHTVFIRNSQPPLCRRRVTIEFGTHACDSNIRTGGGLRLRVKSSTPASVKVDRNYWTPGDFNEAVQLIELVPGTHHVEIDAEDHEPLSFDVTTREFEVVTRTVTLKRVRP